MSCSIRDIARFTGLSTATVSLALRDQGRMAPATRQKVRDAAQKLGYQPLPLLSKALSLARQPEADRFRETLAFLVEHPMEKAPEFQITIYNAALNRALSMGYKLEPILLSGKPAEQRQASRILWTRGIRGLIVCPRVTHRQPRIALDWEHFAGVEIGRTVWMPHNLHKVERSVFYEMIDVMHLLKKAGFRRVGLAVQPEEEKRRRGIYSAAFLMAQQRLPVAQRIPPLSAAGPWSVETLQRWLHQHSPDVLIIYEPRTIPSWLQELGLKIPGDISVCSTNVGDSHFTGMRSDPRALGESCVEMLSLLLDRNELGLHSQPRNWLVKDNWQEGNTLLHPIAAWGVD